MKKENFLKEETSLEEIAQNEKIRKHVKKGIIALGLASTMAGLMLGLSGCGGYVSITDSSSSNRDKESSSSIEDNSSSSDKTSDPSTSDPSSSSSSTQKPEPEMPIEDLEAAIERLANKNFTYQAIDENAQYFVDGNKVKVERVSDANIILEMGEKNYAYTANNEGKWIKTIYENDFRIEDLLYTPLVSTNWTEYDKTTNTFKGEIADHNMEVKLGENGDLYISGEMTGHVSKVGQTAVALPDKEKTIDQTNINPTEELLYEIVNGKIEFNVPYMTEVLEEWLSIPSNMFKLARLECPLKKVIYVSPSADSFKFLMLTDGDQNGQARTFVANDTSIFEAWKNNELATKAEFMDFLTSQKKPFVGAGRVDYEYSTYDYTTAQKQEFDTLTKRVLERIVNKGTQGSSILNDFPETKIPGYDKAKVLFGMRTAMGPEEAGLDMGYCRAWNQYYVLDFNGEVEFVEIPVAASITDGGHKNPMEAVLEEGNNAWIVGTLTREKLNSGIRDYYNDLPNVTPVKYDLSNNAEKKHEIENEIAI